MKPWHIKGSRVYGNGQSYNCTNRVTAEQLHQTLNQYENTIVLNQNIEKQYDKITKQIIQLKLSVNTLKNEIEQLSEVLNELNNRQ